MKGVLEEQAEEIDVCDKIDYCPFKSKLISGQEDKYCKSKSYSQCGLRSKVHAPVLISLKYFI